jgi:hypothetical protein
LPAVLFYFSNKQKRIAEALKLAASQNPDAAYSNGTDILALDSGMVYGRLSALTTGFRRRP